MRKIIFIALTACVVLAACTKNEVRPVVADQQITFQAVIDKASTKAGTFDNGAKYPTNRPFGTFAFFYTTSNGYSKDAPKFIDNAQVSNPTAAEAGSVWTTTPVYYWPKLGYLTFMSYSPYSALSSTVKCEATADAMAEIKIPDWNVNANQTVDIMIADRVDNLQANSSNGGYTGVPTVFRHKLAQIVDFSISTTLDFGNLNSGSPQAGSKLFFLKKIELKDIVTNGSFSSGVQPGSGAGEIGIWSEATTPAKNNYTWYENTEIALTQGAEYEFTKTKVVSLTSGDIKTNGYLLVRPQTFNADDTKKVEITYVIRSYTSATAYSDEVVMQSFNIHSATPSWDINKKYSFNITVGLDQIYWAPSVENWEDGTSTLVPIN
ncbi:MAG: hypothetical protein ACI3Y4_08545 [Candidatus Cryptobacteroides sp.]